MPESTERSAAGGFFIARVVSPGAAAAAAARPRRIRRFSPADNKENVPPRGVVLRCRKSPLPSWYPRSPLHDITTVVNVLERRRARRAQVARAQQRSLNTETSPQTPALTCPPPQEPVPDVLDASPSVPTAGISKPVPDVLDASPSVPTAGISKPFPAESELLASSGSPVQSASLTATNLSPACPKSTEPQKMLCSMINEIEKSAKEYLRNSPKQPPAKMKTAQRTLMSMR